MRLWLERGLVRLENLIYWMDDKGQAVISLIVDNWKLTLAIVWGGTLLLLLLAYLFGR